MKINKKSFLCFKVETKQLKFVIMNKHLGHVMATMVEEQTTWTYFIFFST